MEVPQLIIDLAIMLSTAAVITITFKKIRIPSILGYIVAGFLIGPNFPLFMTVESEASIETLSEIGVVIILFHIGLEFDFHKLADIGSTAIISAAVKMGGVMFTGYAFGRLLGMTTMDCVFLGAMLSISSTVVIQKCFEELGLSDKKFAKLVMGSLVMEDVISVFMMVILTTTAASQDGGSGAALHLFMMVCYLIIWLVLGIYFVPTVLDRAMGLMNSETLTLLSLGFCFLMALLAKWLGFSMELGAFLAGSFFAGTRHVHDIEHVTAGVKDMFGAIFFLSVGMMVDPNVIATRWTSIVPIAIIAVAAKLIFSAVGVLLSGQDAKTAIKSGASLAPIGEFSFIIAGLGISLGVMDAYLYPVIVAASILTIMITPTMIKESDRFVGIAKRIVPEKLQRKIRSYTSRDQAAQEQSSEWKIVLKNYFMQFAIYGSIMLVVIIAGINFIYPELFMATQSKTTAGIITTVIIYAVLIIFAKPFLGRRDAVFSKLWVERLANRTPLVAMIMVKIAVLVAMALVPLMGFFDITNPLILLIIPAVLYVIGRMDFISSYYLQLETRFLVNLNQKIIDQKGRRTGPQHWFDEDYHITSFRVPEGASYIGKSIQELGWGRNKNVYVVKLRRDGKNTAMPSSKTQLLADDKVHVIGDKNSLETFFKTIETTRQKPIRTLRDFLEVGYSNEEHALACTAVQVRGSESYVGKPIRKSGINARGHCMILGIERDGYATRMPDANMIIAAGDILWLVGTRDNLLRIAAQSVGTDGSEECCSIEDAPEIVGAEGL